MNNDIVIIDYIDILTDKRIEYKKEMSVEISTMGNKLILLYLQNFYNVNIDVLDKYKQIYGNYPETFILNNNEEKLYLEKNRLLNISRLLKINKLKEKTNVS